MIPIEYPGRGSRAMEPLAARIDDLVNDLYGQISKNISVDYAIYGHSWGLLAIYSPENLCA